MTEVLSQEEIDALVLLARGNVDLVEEALCTNIVTKGFFKKNWIIDKEKVIEHIQKKVKELEDIPVMGDDDI